MKLIWQLGENIGQSFCGSGYMGGWVLGQGSDTTSYYTTGSAPTVLTLSIYTTIVLVFLNKVQLNYSTVVSRNCVSRKNNT